MDIKAVGDSNSEPFNLIATVSPEEYILGDSVKHNSSCVQGDDGSADVEEKCKIETDDIDNKSVVKNLLQEIKVEADDEDLKDSLLIEKETEDVDKKIFLKHLLAEPLKENDFQDLKENLQIKEETEDADNKIILKHLLAEPPKENDFQDLKENLQIKEEVPASKQLPVDSYCRMITKAILSTTSRSISLQMLFEYIAQNYPSFSLEPDGWQTPIENYLCRSSHFVKALPKDFVEGSSEMWILNPATESKMIACFNRGSSDKIQVNKRSLGDTSNGINLNCQHALSRSRNQPNSLNTASQNVKVTKTSANLKSSSTKSTAIFKSSTTKLSANLNSSTTKSSANPKSSSKKLSAKLKSCSTESSAVLKSSTTKSNANFKSSSSFKRCKGNQSETEEIVIVAPVIRHTGSIFCQCYECKKKGLKRS